MCASARSACLCSSVSAIKSAVTTINSSAASKMVHGQHSSYGDSVLSVQVAYPAVRKGTRHARSTPVFIILPPHIPEDAITVEIIDYGKRRKGRRSKRRSPPPPWLSQGVVEQQEWYHLRSLRPALAGVLISFLFHSRDFLPLWVYLPLMALLIWTAFFTNRN